MDCSFIHLKLKDKSNINKANNKIFELFKLSFDNNIINKNKKESSSQNLEIIYHKKFIKKNVGKMVFALYFVIALH